MGCGAADVDGWSGTEKFPAAEGNGASDVSSTHNSLISIKYSYDNITRAFWIVRLYKAGFEVGIFPDELCLNIIRRRARVTGVFEGGF